MVNDVTDWVTDTFDGVTGAIKDVVTYGFLNPMQSLLAESPWYVAFVAIAALAFVFGGVRALVSTVICLAGIRYFDLWHDAMVTLNMTLVATVLVMILALVFGVWMARDRRVDIAIRPLLDAGQTIPPFVFLIPVLALFGTDALQRDRRGDRLRRTGRHQAGGRRRQGGLADDDRGRPAPRARPPGRRSPRSSCRWPRARWCSPPTRACSTCSSMTVIGGLVGAGALGYDVVYGFARSEAWGKGLAAGITIVLLGVMLDRITRAAADRRRDDGPGIRRAFNVRLPIGPPRS